MGERIKTFVFVDLETTGLPFLECNRTKITEICLTAVQAEHLEMGVFPRVQNKLSLCINPLKLIQFESSEITGLYNDMLENQTKFDMKTVEVIKSYLNLHRSPICLVAHNGRRFDFPILREHFYRVGNELDNDVLCVDSLHAFKNLEITEQSPKENIQISNVNLNNPVELKDETNSQNASLYIPEELDDDLDGVYSAAFDVVEASLPTTPKQQEINVQLLAPIKKVPDKELVNVGSKAKRALFTQKSPPKKQKSYKLVDIYERLFRKAALEGHRAENDVEMTIACAAQFGQNFVDWSNANSQKFCDITPMRIGKKGGT